MNHMETFLIRTSPRADDAAFYCDGWIAVPLPTYRLNAKLGQFLAAFRRSVFGPSCERWRPRSFAALADPNLANLLNMKLGRLVFALGRPFLSARQEDGARFVCLSLLDARWSVERSG